MAGLILAADGRMPVRDWMEAPTTRAVLAALQAEGAEVRFVGGCVRDGILDRSVSDVDLCTPLPPEEVIRLLKAAGLTAVPTGLKHGTVTAVADKKPFEITTLRRDVETFGRHARVAFTDDWQADAARRDFTINALSASPDGTLYDYFHGLSDLAAGRVRFVGDARQRVQEDFLRILRFFRFQARYGHGEPDPEAVDACRTLAPHLTILSGERVRAELFRILVGPAPAETWRLMLSLGVLEPLVPSASDWGRLERLIAVEALAPPRPDPAMLSVARLAATLATDRAGAERIADRLRLAVKERDRLVALVTSAAGFDPRRAERDLRVGLIGIKDQALYRDLVLMAAASEDRFWTEADLAPAWAALRAWGGRQLPISGKHLLAAGIPAGPGIGTRLAAVEAWWAAGGFAAGREACLARALTLAEEQTQAANPGR